METCDNCGSEVTERYHRVFSDNAGTLHGCNECSIKEGSKHPDKVRESRR